MHPDPDSSTDRATIFESPSDEERAGGPRLIVVSGTLLGTQVDLSELPLIIGRSASCGLTLAHPSISRNHCRLWREAGQIWIEDLGSTNRTRVNGRSIERTGLRDGDQISVGQDDLKFFEGASAESRYHQELIDLALYDSLTGFLNRRQFRVLLQKACEATPLERFSLLLLDLDHFKQINDRHGHLVGDQVLAAVSKVLREQIGDSGEFGRIGGEEFALLLPQMDAQTALELAERLRLAVCDRAIEPGPVTVSIGVAGSNLLASGLSRRASDLLALADTALYEAKNGGRNRVVLAR
ncbi:MAG: GGDEF domain-containing protein [Xanthomonadales bacterium]|nr:GGDEF domain-containing protein [Xanthomonadales bacterium]